VVVRETKLWSLFCDACLLNSCPSLPPFRFLSHSLSSGLGSISLFNTFSMAFGFFPYATELIFWNEFEQWSPPISSHSLYHLNEKSVMTSIYFIVLRKIKSSIVMIKIALTPRLHFPSFFPFFSSLITMVMMTIKVSD
jgi:hypothetical protein